MKFFSKLKVLIIIALVGVLIACGSSNRDNHAFTLLFEGWSDSFAESENEGTSFIFYVDTLTTEILGGLTAVARLENRIETQDVLIDTVFQEFQIVGSDVEIPNISFHTSIFMEQDGGTNKTETFVLHPLTAQYLDRIAKLLPETPFEIIVRTQFVGRTTAGRHVQSNFAEVSLQFLRHPFGSIVEDEADVGATATPTLFPSVTPTPVP